MSALTESVRKARRRLWLNGWLSRLGWSFCVAAGVFILFVVLDRVWLTLSGSKIALAALALAVAAVLASVIWATVRRAGILAAAARLDEAAGLKERLSTGLYCRELTDPFAQAVVVNAEQVSRAVDVRRSLPVQVPRSTGYAGFSLAAALLFFWLFPSIDLSGSQARRNQDRERDQRIHHTQATMRPVLQQEIKKVVERNPTLKKDLDPVDALKDAKLETPQDVRREAIKQVEKLTDKLEEKRNSESLAKAQEFQKLMRRLADQQKPSPVGQLAQQLSKADFKAAQDTLKNIEQQLAKAPATPEEQRRTEELRKQLDQLSKKIDQLAKEDKKTQDELSRTGLKEDEIKRALENLKKKDYDALAKQLNDKGLTPKQVDKLMQQLKRAQEASNSAQQLADNLNKGAQPAAGGQPAEAKEGMSAAGQQLSEMEAMQQELNQINASMGDLKSLKEGLGGEGGNKPGEGGEEKGPGMGGPGQGEGGIAGRQKTDFKTAARRSPVNTLPGKIISQQEFLGGEQYKGPVSENYTEAVLAAQRDVQDAIAREQIPRALQGPVSKYFTRATADLPKEKGAAEEPAPAEKK